MEREAGKLQIPAILSSWAKPRRAKRVAAQSKDPYQSTEPLLLEAGSS